MYSEKLIGVELLERAKLLESAAFHLMYSPSYDMTVLESLVESKFFDFWQVSHKKETVLQKAISLGDIDTFNLILNYSQKKKKATVSAEDMMLINFNSESSKNILDALIEKADTKQIKKCILLAASEWMSEEKAWALMRLEKAVLEADKNWNRFNRFAGEKILSKIAANAVRIKEINPAWVQDLLKSEAIKNVTTVCSYDSYKNETASDSALVSALLLDDYALAKTMLESGYRINVPEFMSELEVAIRLGLGVDGVCFLLDNGCSPLEASGNLKVTRDDADLSMLTRGKRREVIKVNPDRLLGVAIRAKSYEVVDLLIEHGLSLDRLIKRASPEERVEYENVLLRYKSLGGGVVKKINSVAL